MNNSEFQPFLFATLLHIAIISTTADWSRFYKLIYVILDASICSRWWYCHVNTNTLTGATILFLGHPYIWAMLLRAHINSGRIMHDEYVNLLGAVFWPYKHTSNLSMQGTFRMNLHSSWLLYLLSLCTQTFHCTTWKAKWHQDHEKLTGLKFDLGYWFEGSRSIWLGLFMYTILWGLYCPHMHNMEHKALTVLCNQHSNWLYLASSAGELTYLHQQTHNKRRELIWYRQCLRTMRLRDSGNITKFQPLFSGGLSNGAQGPAPLFE